MLNRAMVHFGIAGALLFIGVVLQELRISDFVGTSLFWVGMLYTPVGLFFLIKGLIPSTEKVISTSNKNKAYDELIKLKTLLNEGIISQEEFDNRAQELKQSIL